MNMRRALHGLLISASCVLLSMPATAAGVPQYPQPAVSSLSVFEANDYGAAEEVLIDSSRYSYYPAGCRDDGMHCVHDAGNHAYILRSQNIGGPVSVDSVTVSPPGLTPGHIAVATGQRTIGDGGNAAAARATLGGVHTTVTSDIILDGSAELWPCDAGAGPVTITLPPGAEVPNYFWDVKKVDSSVNACILEVSDSDAIDGNASIPLRFQNDDLTIQNSAGSSTWYIR